MTHSRTSLSIFENLPFFLPRTSWGGSYNIGRLNSTSEKLDDVVSRPSVDCLLGVTARQRRRARLVIDFASTAESDLAHSLHGKDDDSGDSGGTAYLPPLAARRKTRLRVIDSIISLLLARAVTLAYLPLRRLLSRPMEHRVNVRVCAFSSAPRCSPAAVLTTSAGFQHFR